ncbi:MAG: delta-60 repeat domain-containing protein, partial [Verrucomicrobiia bacterium]
MTANNGAQTSSIFYGGETSYFIGGEFTLVNGTTINRIAKLDTDGTINFTSFNPGAGANGTVRDLVIDNLGRLIIVGDFTLVNAIPRKGIARLNPDGSVDLSFAPGTGAVQGNIYAVAIDPRDQRIVVGGNFSGFSGAQG